ncbi:hypothetical protein C8R43DRAFT_937331 [Mycena crocata]|nr:hypothetical protein C8R43DRAFT_937331 [Mycena crocata]
MARLAGILDLPTEILIGVFETPSIPTDAIYFVSLLCRRLHFIALPIYLRRQGMDFNLKSVVITMRSDRKDVLSALQTALFTLQTKQITCIFPHPSCTTIFPILPHLQRLRKFISRLESIKTVTLQMDAPESVCLAVGDDSALQAWSMHLADLLNCIVQKRCSSLSMVYGGQLSRTYELIPTRTPQNPITRLSAALQRLIGLSGSETEEFRRVARQGKTRAEVVLSPTVYNFSNLNSLTIRSAIMLLPPGLRWTLAALRNCPITSLTLYHDVVESAIWNAVLPLMASAVPGLKSLVLQRAELLSDSDCLEFLSELPQLRHLTISSTTTSELTHIGPLIGLELQKLESLRAPPRYVQYFLRHPKCFPTIKSICIVWPFVYRTPDIGVFAAILTSTIHSFDARGLSPTISLSVDTSIYRSAAFREAVSPDFRRSLERIEALEIRAIPFFFTDIAEMAAWIAMLRCVQRVDIKFSPSHLDVEEDVERIRRAIRATEFMDRITVNGESYNLVR